MFMQTEATESLKRDIKKQIEMIERLTSVRLQTPCLIKATNPLPH